MPLHFIGSKSTISCFGERFRDGQYSLVSFLFAVLLLTVPSRAQPFVVGGRAPVPYGVGATATHKSPFLPQRCPKASPVLIAPHHGQAEWAFVAWHRGGRPSKGNQSQYIATGLDVASLC